MFQRLTCWTFGLSDRSAEHGSALRAWVADYAIARTPALAGVCSRGFLKLVRRLHVGLLMRMQPELSSVVSSDMHVIDRAPMAPFATPRASPIVIDDEMFWELKRNARRALILVLVPLMAIVVSLGFAIAGVPVQLFAPVIGAATIAGVIGIGLGVSTSIRLSRIAPEIRPSGLAMAVTSIPLGVVTAAIGGLSALMTMVTMTRGRQLRSLGRVELPPVEEGAGWLTAPGAGSECAAATREDLAMVAGAWRENGRTEHASVAAFAKLSIELVALGAPPALIETAHRDALDEMRHTELCFSLARDLDGQSASPGAFPAARSFFLPFVPRSVRLARLAVESLIDGAMNEGISARVVAGLSRERTDPRVEPVLAAIARDEARHAAHGFAIARWCVEAGGHPVRAALYGALAALPPTLGKGLTPDAEDGRWEYLGIPGRARENRAFETVRARVLEKTRRLLVS